MQGMMIRFRLVSLALGFYLLLAATFAFLKPRFHLPQGKLPLRFLALANAARGVSRKDVRMIVARQYSPLTDL